MNSKLLSSLCLILAIGGCFISVKSNAQYYASGMQLNPYGGLVLGRQYIYSKRNDFKIAHYVGLMPRKKYLYSIILKSGDTLQGKMKIQFNNGRSYLMVKEKGKSDHRIWPNDTKAIYITSKSGRKMVGIPSFGDTSWLFQVSKGPINTFAVVPEWGTDYFSAVQKDTLSAPIRITKQTIVSMVKDDPKALKKANKKLLVLAVKAYNEDKALVQPTP